MDCPSLTTCPFFNDKMANRPATAEIMKSQFCKDDFASCARKTVSGALGKDKVPSNLFPNQIEKARELISGSSKTPRL